MTPGLETLMLILTLAAVFVIGGFCGFALACALVYAGEHAGHWSR